MGQYAYDAREVSRRIRLTASREDTIDQLLTIYREVIQEYSPLTLEWPAEEKAVAAYLRWLSPWIKDLVYSHDQITRLEDHITFLEGEKQSLFNSWSWRITCPLRQIKDLLNQFPK